ncbi:DUF6745 domain-containing protein [Singulisphaera sp. Ch08]|uniref:DUF6745 domain-containing protein n=1 Tax=Singulisphaera sp. Ch08 TaxID=3120278 RepID=A0AAU7CC66_9BACT
MVTLKDASGRTYATIHGHRLILAKGGAEYLAQKGRLDLPKLAALSELPPGLSVRRLDLSGCSNLTHLPDGLRVRHLNLADCTALTELPSGLACYEINLSGTGIRSLPADLRVDYRLDLTNCTKLVELPPHLKVGSLVLRDCKTLATLPEGLDVSFLDLRGCERLSDWPAATTIRIGRLNMSGCRRLNRLPDGLGRVAQLDVSDCTALKSLPEGLEIGTSIEIANTAITALPASMAGVSLVWRGVPIDERIAFHPESIEVDEVLEEENAERRRVLLERVGLDRFLSEAKVEVLDEDQDRGGNRRLLRVPLEGDEDLVCVMVHCPSTGGRYLLRVPPYMETCRQAVAWTAGFDDPNLYRPLVET